MFSKGTIAVTVFALITIVTSASVRSADEVYRDGITYIIEHGDKYTVSSISDDLNHAVVMTCTYRQPIFTYELVVINGKSVDVDTVDIMYDYSGVFVLLVDGKVAAEVSLDIPFYFMGSCMIPAHA